MRFNFRQRYISENIGPDLDPSTLISSFHFLPWPLSICFCITLKLTTEAIIFTTLFGKERTLHFARLCNRYIFEVTGSSLWPLLSSSQSTQHQHAHNIKIFSRGPSHPLHQFDREMMRNTSCGTSLYFPLPHVALSC